MSEEREHSSSGARRGSENYRRDMALEAWQATACTTCRHAEARHGHTCAWPNCGCPRYTR